MDILKPELIWVDGRCYRVNSTKGILRDSSNKLGPSQDEEDIPSGQYSCTVNDEPCDVAVEETDGQFKVNISVPSDFFSYIIGKKGATKHRIEQETKTRIIIPKQGVQGSIVVVGEDRRGVVSAKTRIDVLVNNVRQKTSNTHFVSVPFNAEPVLSGFLAFKDDVLRYCGDCRGIDETLFQKPNKLHLTLGTLVLMDTNERQRAGVILNECLTEFINIILDGKPIEVYVEGIEYMNDDPAEVNVLYAKLKHNKGHDDLMQITDLLVEKFVESGLMQEEYRRVKLHLTIMNTLFRKTLLDPSVAHDKQDKVLRESFDATEILKRFGNYTFGRMKIATIQISQLHSKSSDKYYGCTALIYLPT